MTSDRDPFVKDRMPTPEQLPRIFEKFYQADNQDVSGIRGTGLGLAVSLRIVEAHSGMIEAANLPGGGASFTVYLPTKQK